MRNIFLAMRTCSQRHVGHEETRLSVKIDSVGVAVTPYTYA